MSDEIQMLLQAYIAPDSIKDLKKQISDIQNDAKPLEIKVDTSKGTSSIKNMATAVERLEEVTKKNLSLDLERLSARYRNLIKSEDVAQIRSMINSLSATDPKLGHNIDLIKVKMKEVTVGAEQSKKALDLANKSAMSFGEAMKTAAYKFGIWSAITASYYKAIREIANGVRFINEMNSALTEIGMVTNQTREQTAGLAKEYNNLAKQMKVLTSEVTSGAVTFYRQGLSQEEVMKRLKVTTMYSKVANVDFQQSAELLTATVNSLGIEIEKAADVFLFLGDSTATSGAEVAKGFSKTSGAVAALGLEFEKVASWIAVISAKTRESSESIGHSINTMLSRLSRITETGFNEEDSTSINDVAKALNSVDIALTDTQGNFRNFGTILDEIYAKWGKLDDQTKAYIANTMAGTRQQSRFYNLMAGYAESMDLYTESLEAAGTAQSKFQKYLESNQATIDKFKATIEGLWTTVINSDSLMSLVKFGTSIVDLLDSMVQQFGVLGTLINTIAPLIGLKLALSFRKAYIEMMKMAAANNVTLLPTPKTIGMAIKGMLGFAKATDGAVLATGKLTLATGGLTLIIGGIALALAKMASNAKKAKEAFANALDNSQNLSDELNTLEQLAKKQQELNKIEGKTAEQKEELLKVQRELAQLYPELATGVDTEGNKIAENTELTKELVDAKKKLLEQELLVIKTTADTKLPKLREELIQMQEEADVIQQRLASGDVWETKNIDGIKTRINITKKLKDRLLELVETQKEHVSEISKLETGVKSYNKLVEERIEIEKWTRVEELQSQHTRAQTIQQYQAIEKELLSMGFTHSDVRNIISGNIDIVKEKYKELDMQLIIDLQTIENLDATQKQAMANMLESSRVATEQLIEDAKSRIMAIKAEMEAWIALAGSKTEESPFNRAIGLSDEQDYKNMFGDTAGMLELDATVRFADAHRELAKLEDNLKDIDRALDNVRNIDTSKMSGTRDPDRNKKKKEYVAEADRYKKLNLELDKNNVLLQKNKIFQDLAKDSLYKKLDLIKEEKELTEQRQISLNKLNNERRRELIELENYLSKQGFLFSGKGDSRIIDNLDHIQGKTKEVEEAFNRYIDLQSRLIPQASQEWLDLENGIKRITDAIKEMNQQIYEMQRDKLYLMYTDGIDNIKHQISIQQELIDLTDDLDKKANIHLKINSLTESQIHLLKKLNAERQKELDILKELGSMKSDRYRNLLDEYRSTELLILQLQRRQIQERESIANDVISSIKEGYRKMLELEKASVQDRVKVAEEEHKRKIALLDDWLSHHNGIIDEMLEDMNRLNATEDYEDRLDDLTKQKIAAENTLEIALGLSDTAVDKDIRVAEAKKELEKINKSIEKTMRDRARSLRKEELTDTKKHNEQIIQDKKDSEQAKIDEIKRTAEEEIRIIEIKYDKLINNDRMYESIREEIMKGTYTNANKHITKILNSLQRHNATSVQAMGKSWQELENAINRVISAQKKLQNMNLSFNTSAKKYKSHEEELDKQIIGELQRNYTEFVEENPISISTKEQQENGYLWRLNQQAESIRKKHGWGYADYSHLLAPGFAQGGVIDFTGVANVHGSKMSSEVVFNAEQAKKLYEYVKRLPDISNITSFKLPESVTGLFRGIENKSSMKEDNSVLWDIDIHIGEVTGGKEGGEQVYKHFIREIKKKGGTI